MKTHAPTLPSIATPHSIALYYSRLRSYCVGTLLEKLFTPQSQERYSDDMPGLYRASEIRELAQHGITSDGMTKIAIWIDQKAERRYLAQLWYRMESEHDQEARALYLRHIDQFSLSQIAEDQGYSARYASKMIQRGELRVISFFDSRSYTRDIRDKALDELAALASDANYGYDAAMPLDE